MTKVTLTLTGSGGELCGGVTHSVAVTITDNDVAAVTAPISVVVPEGGSRDLSGGAFGAAQWEL